ncbi:P-loop containing nucleoside triphosphate hydrolase protein [Dendryphion nanum]|uniref:P-loop containing nucleoside triphosphate hydrolase protein n=1 Tax=Dendryphion nanum TaxID=256645 RepID=A0A9P9IKE0_9PLEO|nr:P-loop containing nucleoside triphosphate hydrolase protein [Dendryphion nanum]
MGSIVVAVMGLTGVGKSTFIKTLTGNEEIIIGHTLTSETNDVHGYSFQDEHHSYILVDTPGFDDTFLSNAEITAKITEWLSSSKRSGIQLNGIIYLHSIVSPRMQGSMYQNLRMFRQLCGPNGLQNVTLATTFWNSIEETLGEQRESDLIGDQDFWGRMVALGSKVLRLGLDRNSALAVLRSVPIDTKIDLEPQTIAEPVAVETIDNNLQAEAQQEIARLLEERRQLLSRDKKRWRKTLNQMEARVLSQAEELRRFNTQKEFRGSRMTVTVGEHESKAQLPIVENKACSCRLNRVARCGLCNRIVARVNRTFYRKSIGIVACIRSKTV